ncbi:hypothetical protein [Novosphingobium aquimarinum]|uniref:hypothetical protein n=1 Tax=Novosphingobium aquimarinum TaxID=2682494 RepID=UPI0012EC28D0|nr:hypothetical protein [Novosphingobium aquimarinum]
MKRRFAAMALFLLPVAGCSREPDPMDGKTNETLTSLFSDNKSSEAETEASDCSGFSPDPNGLVGVQAGMTPMQAAAILTCQGYTLGYPKPGDYDDDRRRKEEAKQNIFRMDFRKTGEEDYARLFYEGPPDAPQVYAIGRTSYFGENPPLLQAVAKQFLNKYDLPRDIQTKREGIIGGGKITPSNNPVGYVSGGKGKIAEHCTNLAFLHDPESRFSTMMNRGPYPDQNCGPFMTVEVLANGRNAEVAYVTRYRLGDPQLGFRLREARRNNVEAEAAARQAQEVDAARNSGVLPDL